MSATSRKCAPGSPEEEVARVALRVIRLIGDVPLGDEQVHEAVVVHVRELGVPGGRRPACPSPVNGWEAFTPAAAADLVVDRPGRRCSPGTGGGLPPGSSGSSQGSRPRSRRRWRSPSLPPGPATSPRRRCTAVAPRPARRARAALAVFRKVHVPVVAHPQVLVAGSVPVGEEHRQGAPSRCERAARVVGPFGGLGRTGTLSKQRWCGSCSSGRT